MHLNLRRAAPFIVVIFLAAVAFWFFWGEDGQQENGPLSASGTIEAHQVVLASEIGGKVTDVLATEGELVRIDDALVKFDDKLLLAQLDQAQAALVQAQANYNLVAKGLPEEQRQLAVTTAEMELLSAQQALDDLYEKADLMAAGALQEIAQAEKAIDYARRRQNNLVTPADQADIDDAFAGVVLARDALDKAQDKYEPYKKKKEDNVIRATLLRRVAEAQNYYDVTVTRLNNITGDADDIELAIADSDLAMAIAQKADAERRYSLLKEGPDPDDVALAEARMETAKANLEFALAEPSQEQLDLAQALVDSAQAAINIMVAQLGKFTLTAPVDGIVLERVIEQGEVASPGSPLLTLAQLDDLTITVYVPEDRYGEILLGQAAQVNVDSFPGEEFPGLVVHIADQAEYTPRNVQTQEGRRTTVFAIKMKINNPEGKLKPGMPADVTFDQ
jgi:multidrug efflux pump subunit AcrA (membrane-fusion protein)